MYVSRAGFMLILFAALFILSASAFAAAINNADVLGESIILTPTVTPMPSPTPTPIPSPTITPTPTRKPKPTPTLTPKPTPIIITSTALKELFTKYGNEYSVDTELLKRIARCESGFNPNAQNRGYAGLFQFTESLWRSTRNLMGQNPDANLRFNPEQAIKTAAFMISQHHLSLWPDCGK